MSPSDLRVPSFELVWFGRPLDTLERAQLAHNDFFEGVAVEAIGRHAGLFRSTRLPRGTLLFERWHVSTHAFLVLDGAVRLERAGPDGKAGIGSVLAGEFCGEDALLPGIARVHATDARCVRPSTVAFAHASDLAMLVESEPAVALNVARSLYERLSALTDVLSE